MFICAWLGRISVKFRYFEWLSGSQVWSLCTYDVLVHVFMIVQDTYRLSFWYVKMFRKDCRKRLCMESRKSRTRNFTLTGVLYIVVGFHLRLCTAYVCTYERVSFSLYLSIFRLNDIFNVITKQWKREKQGCFNRLCYWPNLMVCFWLSLLFIYFSIWIHI